MNILKRILPLVTALALVACGGGGGSPGANPNDGGGNGGTTTPRATDLVLVLSAASVANTGLESVVATATALDSNRNVVVGVPVTVSVDSGGIVIPAGTVTDSSGAVTASIGIGSDRAVRTLTVTAISGTLTRSAQLQVADAGGSTSDPSDVVLQLNSGTIANTGTQTVTATVTTLDAKRNTLPGVAVTVSVDNDATAALSSSTTNSAGVLTAQIGIGGNNTNRDINVVATAGGITRTAVLQVTNTGGSQGPVANDLGLTLSSASLNNGGTNTIRATVTAVDVNRNVVAGIPVTIQVDASAVAAVSSRTTNAQGIVTADVGIGTDRSNRLITVTATSGALTRSATFAVVGARLTAAFAPVVDTGSVGNDINFTLVDTNANPMADVQYNVVAPDGTNKSGRTDLNGAFSFRYNAPATAGQFKVTATAAGASSESLIAVTSEVIAPVAANLTILSGSVTPTPTVIAVNTSSATNNQVELRALFAGRDTTSGQINVPIPNVRTRFEVLNNQDETLGTVSWIGTYAIADVNGISRAIYRPGSRSSPTDGVTVRACWDRIDFNTSTCPNAAIATLTVVDEALSVSIRTNELIKSGLNELTYIKEFVVMVVDASGQAKADVQITPSIDLTAYYKGYYVRPAERWIQVPTLATDESYRWSAANLAWEKVAPASPPQPSCPNEDVNRNGIREASAVSLGVLPVLANRREDMNWNGELDPRKADVAIKMVGSPRTDSNGLAVVQIEYGKNLGSWVDFLITVTASGISGTESRARYAGTLPVATAALLAVGSPAFQLSPYGQSDLCTDSN